MAALFALTASLALSPAALAQDGPGGNGRLDVLNARGEVTPLQPVLVISETLDEVRFRRGSSSRTETRRTDQVVHIEYGTGSDTYESALAALDDGDLVQAVNLLTAAAEQDEPGWQAAVALLKLGETQARRGGSHLAEARSTLDSFLSEHPDHRRLPEALLLRGRYALAAGEASAMETAAQRVAQLVEQGRTPGTWKARAEIELGDSLLANDRASEAQASYKAAQATAERARSDLAERADLVAELDRLALDARSGTGSALLAAGDLRAARTYFEALQADAGGARGVEVAALNGLAQVDLEEGGHDKLKQAQLGFAKAAVLGAAIDDQHAKSLYFLGRCALALAETGSGDANGARAEAREYAKLVQARYPESRWARMARESLP
ncbi:MAG: hypothetical protein DHS20C15_21920 [Planctomycetota bacterium]|nr:MAG: hypothetical protein DHS20C15_21920 [Planctomycetota bacterium]